MTLHFIEPERATLHGAFSRDRAPVLEIDPGDTVRFRTLDAGWGLEPQRADGTRRRQFEPRDPEADRGHALCGPIAIRGALPGMTLEVRIGELRTGGWGWNVGGGLASHVNDGVGVTGEELTLRWTLDDDAGIATSHLGRRVRMNPHLGVMGMPPDLPSYQPTAPPRITGGNIDCKELVSGSSLFLPIAVPGGLFSTGDGHAAMADGEASRTGIECPMERADLTFILHEDMPLNTPRVMTAAGWITLGFHEDLDDAMVIALDAMLDLMSERYGMARREAIAIASLVVDLRITQVVNGVRGVHAVLAHDALLDPLPAST